MLVTPDVFEQGYERRGLEFRMVTPVAALLSRCQRASRTSSAPKDQASRQRPGGACTPIAPAVSDSVQLPTCDA
jgi:hypothetical protein